MVPSEIHHQRKSKLWECLLQQNCLMTQILQQSVCKFSQVYLALWAWLLSQFQEGGESQI